MTADGLTPEDPVPHRVLRVGVPRLHPRTIRGIGLGVLVTILAPGAFAPGLPAWGPISVVAVPMLLALVTVVGGQALLAGRVSVIVDDVGLLVPGRAGRAGTHHAWSALRSVTFTVDGVGRADLRLQPRGQRASVVEFPAATAGFHRRARQLLAHACRRHGVDLTL